MLSLAVVYDSASRIPKQVLGFTAHSTSDLKLGYLFLDRTS